MHKNFTRLISLVVLGTMLFACSCGKSQPIDTPTPETSPVTTPDATPVPDKYDLLQKTDGGSLYSYSKTNANYTLVVDTNNKVHEISDMLYGIFFEDINFAADGGLYAEMVQNRSFEFTSIARGNEFHGWNTVGSIEYKVIKTDKEGCLNSSNPNYLVMENKSDSPAGVANKGFLDGMAITKGAEYKFSVWARGVDGYTGPLTVSLMSGSNVAATAEIPAVTDTWAKYTLVLTSTRTANSNVKLQVTIPSGKVALDMVSLFPADTYKGRENGLRKDLAEQLEALNPSFVRFPGGCVIEGKKLSQAYNWKYSIGVGTDGEPILFNGTYGDVAARKQTQNLWTNASATSDDHPSFMSYGLGFYEYFLLAEDLGAVGLPVLNCGVACMGQSAGEALNVNSDSFKKYVQDALDLVEFCRGDETTKWGSIRIAMGHKEPFALKYIAIGNEQWDEKYYSHYTPFVDAFMAAAKENPAMYGDIELIFSSGVDDGDSDKINYPKAYQFAEKYLKEHPDITLEQFAGAIDQHYYNEPAWFFAHNDYYDPKNYSRDKVNFAGSKYGGGINVFLGEYAAHSNKLKAALAEASYMTGLERNGDIVKMAAYAPLFGQLTRTHWAPDLIWFNNHQVTCSTNYYVQQIFCNNVGRELLSSEMNGHIEATKPLTGCVGVGTWSTAAKFDNLLITSNKDGSVLASCNLDSDDQLKLFTKVSDGNWSVKDGMLVQSSTTTDTGRYGNTGSAVYFGDNTWTDYTFTVDAVKTGGAEGFLIPFAVGSKNENYFWNIGGWNNTISCLQQVHDGAKSDQLNGTTMQCAIRNNQTYKLKIVVSGFNVKCYIDEKLYVDYNIDSTPTYECYHVVSSDESGDIIIKMVNVTGDSKTVAIDLGQDTKVDKNATIYSVAGNSLDDDNYLGQTPAVTLKTYDTDQMSSQFNFEMPKYSVTVIRVHTTLNK